MIPTAQHRKRFMGLPVHPFGIPLAIEPVRGRAILGKLERMASLQVYEDSSPESGMVHSNPVPQVAAGSVGVIPVLEVLTHRDDPCMEIMGGTSYFGIRRSIQSGLDMGLRKFLLDIESPGGVGNGLWELGVWLDGLQAQGVVIESIIRTYGCSAAYYIASSTRRISATLDADVGNIGVYWCHFDESKALEQEGIAATEIKAGRYKGLGTSVRSLEPDEKVLLQDWVDYSMTLFVDHVAKHRRMTVEEVLSTDALSVYGPAATKAFPSGGSIADEVATFDQVLERLGRETVQSTPPASVQVPGNFSMRKRPMNRANEAHIAPVQSAVAQAHAGAEVIDMISAESDGKVVFYMGGNHFMTDYKLLGEEVALGTEMKEVTPSTSWLVPGEAPGQDPAVLQAQLEDAVRRSSVLKTELEAANLRATELRSLVDGSETEPGLMRLAAEAVVDLGIRRGTMVPAQRESYVGKGSSLEGIRALDQAARKQTTVIPTRSFQAPGTEQSDGGVPEAKPFKKLTGPERREWEARDPKGYKAAHDKHLAELREQSINRTR